MVAHASAQDPLATRCSFPHGDSNGQDKRGLVWRYGRPIKIEGHADERGSAEYNLALGQKRAQAVLNALRIYGAKASQMEAISWGEERAKVQGHSEMAWAQNRRADLAYPR